MERRHLHAFTLIELLIVVAIIAILAAIAVPNFLEAQTRSKVSRVLAEFRTVATAVESYHVDHAVYPAHMTPTGAAGSYQEPWGLIRLTTPIAYLTQVHWVDPFRLNQDLNSNNFRYFNFYLYTPVYDDRDPQEPRTGLRNLYRKWSTAANHPLGNEGWHYYNGVYMDENNFADQFKWMIHSYGPDRINNLDNDTNAPSLDVTEIYLPYDPTNGTVSMGDMIRMGP